MDELTPLFGVPMNDTSSFLPSDSGGGGDINASPQSTPATLIPAGGSRPAPAPKSDHYVEQDGKHTGVAGVARDILGTLGDFLLTRLHMKPMYWPAQESRQLSAAMEGFDQDPLGAINRVTDVNPTVGMKLRDQFIDNQRMAAQQSSTQEARESRMALARQAMDERTRARAGAMLNTMTGWDDDKRQANYPALRDQVLRYGKANGLDLSNELPSSYDGNTLDAFIDTSVPVGTQRAQRLASDRLDETSAHNQSTEEYRDRRATEIERHNQVSEGQGQQRIDETGRHNQTSEGIGQQRVDETGRHNRSYEDYRSGRAAEVARHNQVTEAQGQQRINNRPHVPQEGERRTLGGKTYIWKGGKAVLDQ